MILKLSGAKLIPPVIIPLLFGLVEINGVTYDVLPPFCPEWN